MGRFRPLSLCLLTICIVALAHADTQQAAEPVAEQPTPSAIEKGLAWLVSQQQDCGGWGQGEESARMAPGANVRDVPNVADTAIAALALIRAGSTPSDGPYSTAVNRAVDFICREIEASDNHSLWITNVRGTRVQSKIGPYADTFLAALLLAEVQNHMPTEADATRVLAAMTTTLHKIESHQQEDGRWPGRGWAGGLSNAFAVKALNRAAQLGFDVNENVRERAEQSAQARARVGAGGRFGDDGRSAGIELYAAASAVGELADSAQSNVRQRREVEGSYAQNAKQIAELDEKLANGGDGENVDELKRERARLDLLQQANRAQVKRFDAADADLALAQQAVRQRMNDARFVAGFGTNGGEEFISYLNLGEALVLEGGEAWEHFNRTMQENLGRAQNDDGSWTGHHCITGRTFCTASALLVLTVDRSPNAIAARLND